MKKIMVALPVCLSLLSIPAFPQTATDAAQRLKVAVILPDLETDDAVIETTAKVIYDTIALNLILTDRYSVDRIEFLAPAKGFAKAHKYLVDRNYDGAIWGLIGRGAEGIRIRLSAWKRGEDKPVVEESADGIAALGIFDVADSLTLSILRRFTGTRMALGTLRFRPSGDPIAYRVKVNGEFAGEGIETLKVPAVKLRIGISAFVNGREFPQKEVVVTVPEEGELEFPFRLEAPKATVAADDKKQAVPAKQPESQLSEDAKMALIKALDLRQYRDDGKILGMQLTARLLRNEDKKYFYDKYSLSWAILPALGNTFYGLGSWFQGDYLGGVWCTGTMMGGLILIVNNTGNSTLQSVGTASMIVGMISGWIIPFVFESNNNSKLKSALQYYP